jgi:3-dehydroquinate dehydratase/shikimate dehydrogenase
MMDKYHDIIIQTTSMGMEGGEGARIGIMARGLAYAEADKRRNFAYIDIEDDLNVSSLEEAARTFGTRIIRSYHNVAITNADLRAKIRSIPHSGDDIIKLSVKANSTRDVLELLRASRECKGKEKIIIAMGHYGVYSRILAEQFGSYLSYSAALNESDAPVAAPGQLDIRQLAELYRFRSITKNTKVYGVIGHPLKVSLSPYFFNTIFNLESVDAVYAPFPVDSIKDFTELAQELDICGLSVTVPYKKEIIPFLNSRHPDVDSIGACNTMYISPTGSPTGWTGTNTDARGFSDSLLAFTGRSNFKKLRITVIGAGGAAQAVVYELHRLGAKVLILNRTAHKARDLAAHYKFSWGGLDNKGIAMMDKYHDIIIQTTSMGMEGGDAAEPVEMYQFNGREEVMDLVYKPEMTPFLKRAEDAGCRVQNGYDMLIRQARYQYAQFTGKEFPEHLLTRVQFGKA